MDVLLVPSFARQVAAAQHSLTKLALAQEELAAAAKDVNTEPTDAQKESGSYKKGHVRWKGLGITIENPKGSTRSGKSKDGTSWSNTMTAHYGYIKQTESESDGDHIDVFLAEDDLDSDAVFVINQVDPDTGDHDEHKAILGVGSEDRARELYLSNYSKGWKGLGSVVPLTVDEFKEWISTGDTSKAANDPECCPSCGAQLERGDDGHCNRCGQPWPVKSAGLPAALIGAGVVGGGNVLLDRVLHDPEHRNAWRAGIRGAALGAALGYVGNEAVSLHRDATAISGAMANPSTSLGDEVGHYYDNAPGGFDAAVARAIAARRPVSGAPGLAYTAADVDTKMPVAAISNSGLVMNRDSIGATFPPLTSLGIPEAASLPGAHLPIVMLRDEMPTGEPRQGVLEHELTHASLDLAPTDRGELRMPSSKYTDADAGTGYLTSTSELLPRVAEIKRHFVAAHPGSDVTTPEEVNAALEWWKRQMWRPSFWDKVGPGHRQSWDTWREQGPEFWDRVRAVMPQVVQNDNYRSFDDKIAADKQADLLPDVVLQPHQKEVRERGKTPGTRMLLYHTLGSGKSLSAISAAEEAKAPYTVVTPAALRPNFEKEISKFTDETTPSKVVSYNAVARGQVEPTDTVILDEMHRARNPDSQTTKQTIDLTDKARNLYMLSGSPIVNRPNELAPMIRMLTGVNYDPDQFDEHFVDERKISPGFFGWLQGIQPVSVPAIKNEEEFDDLLKGHVHYHAPDKPDVEQIEEHHESEMSPEQADLYRGFWDKLPWIYRWKLQNSFPLTRQELVKFQAFVSGPRQVGLSTYPFMRGKGDPLTAYKQSPKLQQAVGMLKDALKDPDFRGEVYSNFIDAGLKPYAAALEDANIPYGIFHGGLNDAARKRVVEDYNNGRTRVVLIGPSGSEGISLKGTRIIQILDPHFNSARAMQAVGRGVRFDSHTHLPPEQRNVRVQRFVSRMPRTFWEKAWRTVFGAPKEREDARQGAPGVDSYLEEMNRRKDSINQVFLDELKEIGSQKDSADVYHGSSTRDIAKLEPRPSHVLGGEKAVFGTHDRDLAVAFSQPWTDDDFELGRVNDEPHHMRERRPGAFEEHFAGKPGAIYTLPEDNFAPDERLMGHELVARTPVTPQSVEEIGDAWAELQKTNIQLKRKRPKSPVLQQLLQAKAHSDRKNWPAKNAILQKLIKEHPEDFHIEAQMHHLSSLTHKPTGFRIHMPSREIPTLHKAGANEEDKRPYRDRVEMYAVRDGRVLGGLYDQDRTHGVFGGGIDPGEDPAAAAAREFYEESGRRVADPVMLDVPPVTHDWHPPYATPQQEERAKQFRGSRTLFAAGRLTDDPRDAEVLDPSHLRHIRLRKLDTAIKRIMEHAPGDQPYHPARIAALEALKQHPYVTGEKVAAFAPGIESKADYGDLSKLQAGQLLDYIIQHHKADRAGPHYDVRLGDQEMGLHSWAVPKGPPPRPGGKHLAIHQPVHSHEYGQFEGEIESGYGKGTVKKVDEGQVLITKVSPDAIHFTTAHKRHPERYSLIRPKGWKSTDWLLINSTPTEPVPYAKLRYKKIPAEHVESALRKMKPDSTTEAKIDGASSLVSLAQNNIDLLSYRTSKTTGRPIIHGERFFGKTPEVDIPKEYRGSILRGEMYGEREGKAIHPSELGTLLNSSVGRSLETQRERGIDLKTMLFDVQQFGGKPVDIHKTPFAERRRMLEEVYPHLPEGKFEISPGVKGPEEGLKLWEQIGAGEHPKTTEGIVVHPQTGKPWKAKYEEEHDVHVTGTFPGEGKRSQTVGGFTYGHEPGKTVGKVGTGFSDQFLDEVARDPAAWTGRVIRVKAQEKLPSGALRAPVFIAPHEDYPTKSPTKMAEQTKEAARKGSWVQHVMENYTSTDPPKGIFTRSAKEIVAAGYDKEVAPKGLVSWQRMVVFHKNRSGSRLTPERRRELDKAIKILSERIREERINRPTKVAAYSYVPRAMLDDVMREGIYSSEALLDKPELFERIAKARGEDPDQWRKDIHERLAGWKPESSRGANIMFKGPPAGQELAATNPMRTMDLARLRVDLTALLRDHPDVKLHGHELIPYREEDDARHGDDYPGMRHHDLTQQELARLSRMSAKKLWKDYDPKTSGCMYAPNVPHASVQIPGGVLPAKYLKVAEDDDSIVHNNPIPILVVVRRTVTVILPAEGHGASDHQHHDSDDDHPFTIAVDLDGTLAEKEEPFDPESIGEPREHARQWLTKFKDAGARIIIFTVRGDEGLVRDWLDEHDIPFDYINENPDQPPDSSGKVWADVYWDDKAINAEDLEETGPQILELMDKEGMDGGFILADDLLDAVAVGTKAAMDKEALTAKTVAGVTQRALASASAGTWKPSAVAMRKRLPTLQSRMDEFAERTNQWVNGTRIVDKLPADAQWDAAVLNFHKRAPTSAVDRALNTWREAAKTAPTISESWLTHPNAGKKPWWAPFSKGRTPLQAAARSPNVPASLTEERAAALQKAYGLGDRAIVSNVAPKLEGGAYPSLSGVLAGTVDASASLPTLLHEIGHLADPQVYARHMNRTPRNVIAMELSANRNASKALANMHAAGEAPPLTPGGYWGSAQKALETYRLTNLAKAMKGQLSSSAYTRTRNPGPWPRQLTFNMPAPTGPAVR